MNLLLTLYLLKQYNKLYSLKIEFLILKENYKRENYKTEFHILKENFTNENMKIDKDMVGLEYPEIDFQRLKNNFLKGKIISSYIDLLTNLEIKLLYLEKEINCTKLITFFTARTLYLKNNNVSYDDSKIIEYNDIINWLIIHKSTQLKGIASDKYLACKYVEKKLGKNLCPHRIAVYDSVEEIDFEKIIKRKNIVLKVTNGFSDNIFITDKYNLNDIENIKNLTKFHFNREYALRKPSFFHLYSKKRIIAENIFIPNTDLFEFKMMLFNHEVKMIMLDYFIQDRRIEAYYDGNFNCVKDDIEYYDLSKFDKSILNEVKSYAIKLSEDFPNFVRVDLYIFHNKIYLSELTFDSHAGMPMLRDIKYFVDIVKTWKRVDN